MTSAAKRDEQKQMDQDPADLNTETDKAQNQKHYRSGPEHTSLLSRYSLQTFSFPKACGLCNVAQVEHTYGRGLYLAGAILACRLDLERKHRGGISS